MEGCFPPQPTRSVGKLYQWGLVKSGGLAKTLLIEAIFTTSILVQERSEPRVP